MMDERSELETLREIYYLTDDGSCNWRKLLALGDCLDQQLKRKLLWMWPTSVDLDYFNQLLAMHDIQRVLSIGCGSGLLEWLMTVSGGRKVPMFGLEVDRNWWQSKYSVRSFIPLNYLEDASQLNTDLLAKCCSDVHPCALLFCYFNNRGAFLDYLKVFQGKWLILIGPLPALGIHTDPNPAQPQLPIDQWILRERLNWTDHNIVAFYEKIA
ncbi:uncharacterized protein LOC120284203 [Drosophila simulans]|uniref:uncharacterized protein LOC120284203 n=1 Tax=Drosophila simulans TaxID=7240 RepID=UPI00078AE967|nr:uncharacterized protein LOC120284203 [Drosophila simulans]KMZ03403.1 uncharacterized protein Dsimw501_GD19016 [Drosophila simulans]